MRGGVDHRPALAFGGGIGHAGDVCGAVTAGAIAIGLLCGDRIPDLQEAKLRARELALPFYRDFEAEFGQVDCRSLIDLDISTDEGFARYRESTLKTDRCTRYVKYAVDRLWSVHEELKCDR